MTTCGLFNLVGGDDAFGRGTVIKKTFSNLPTHYRINIRVTVWMIQSWDREKFFVQVDGKNVADYTSWTLDNPFHWCGNNGGWRSKTEYVDISVPHTGSSVTISFTSNLDEDPINESFGLRDFELSTVKCVGNCIPVTEELFEDTFTADALSGWQFDKDYKSIITKCDKSIVGGF